MKWFCAAVVIALLPVSANAAPELADCPRVVRELDDAEYGHGWLMECREGLAFVVPNPYHRWAILYPRGAELTAGVLGAPAAAED